MKSVGDRIRQAREYRKLSGEELARRVGYKTQSGIGNLENRAAGRGGFALPRIAEELNFAISWFLQGPDTQNMAEVPTFRPHLEPDTKGQLRVEAPPPSGMGFGKLLLWGIAALFVFIIVAGAFGLI